LVFQKTISLTEALTGYSFVLSHLDGSKHLISSSPGEITVPGSVRTVEDLGMPVFQHPIRHGNLFLVFEVEFPGPNFITYDVAEAIKNSFPDHMEEVDLDQFPQEKVHKPCKCKPVPNDPKSEKPKIFTREEEPAQKPATDYSPFEDEEQGFHDFHHATCSGTIF
jgi:DnaJ family protein A protein 2